MQSTPSTAATYRFTVDGKEFQSAKKNLTGAELRAIAGIAHNVRIFAGDHKKHEADRQILLNATVDLSALDAKIFYTLAEPSMDIF